MLPKGFFGGLETGVTVNEALGVVIVVELKREAGKGFDELFTGEDIKENDCYSVWVWVFSRLSSFLDGYWMWNWQG